MSNLKKIGIIDYGTGNIASIFKAINTIGAEPFLVSNKKQINKFNCLILPGVGHFGEALKNIKKTRLNDIIYKINQIGVPILGICLGFQLLTESSEESLNNSGLGLFPFKTERIKIKNSLKYKVPHLGWNSVTSYDENLELLKGIKVKNQLFYYSNAYGIYDQNLSKVKKLYMIMKQI